MVKTLAIPKGLFSERQNLKKLQMIAVSEDFAQWASYKDKYKEKIMSQNWYRINW